MSTEQLPLLISFCNQLSSPHCSLCVIDTSNRDSRWIDFSDLPDDLFNNFSGVCGICQVGDDAIITTQGEMPILAVVSIVEAKLKHHIVLNQCKDPHSLLHYKGHVYVTSTGTNEIYRIMYHDGQLGQEELFWQYPGVGYEKDEVHLNGITRDKDGFIASCFGPRKKEGGWAEDGRIFYIESGISIHIGLNQPHTPIVENGQLMFAESAANKVFLYHKPETSWKKEKEIVLNGYTRGLALRKQSLLIGVSASRKLSRSQGKFLYESSNSGDSELVVIDLATTKPVDSFDLLPFGREPYDVLEIDKTPELAAESNSVNVRLRKMESLMDVYLADVGSLFQQVSNYKLADSGLVSVIIPTYNRGHLIEASIRSVLEQTYTNLELILVDDGSTDNTAEVAGLFSDPRFHYVQQPNRGRSNARNHALSLVKGKYITFLDSDDLYLPNKIEIQVDYLKNNPGTGMVYTSAHCINEQGEMIKHKYEATVSGLIYESVAFFSRVTITLPTVMTYKNIMDSVGGFDEKMHRFEDTDMWRRISKNFRIDAMPDYTCLLRTHDDNSLLNQDPDKITSALDYYAKKILKEDIEVPTAVWKRGLGDLYFYYAKALKSVPQFSDKGKNLMRIANSYEPMIFRYARFFYYRFYYRVGRVLRRLLRKG